MGYNIIGDVSKKKIYSAEESLVSIMCPYAYQQYFREAFGCEITDWDGRLLKKDREEFLKGVNNFIKMLDDGLDIPLYRGNLSNISPTDLKDKFIELKNQVEKGNIKYLIIG